MALSFDFGVEFFTNKPEIDPQKRRGGYYTPTKLARYLSEWAIRGGDERVLEPSSGDGNFVVAALDHLASRFPRRRSAQIVAVEIEKAEQRKAKARTTDLVGSDRVEWLNDDFFALYSRLRRGKRFDVVLGNPPFIRFQYFDEGSRETAFAHLRGAGYRPNKLANAWAAFIQLSIELLAQGGRLAMVVPAELLQVGYAAELRNSLALKFDHVVIVGFRRLVFPEIQQEVVLLLAEGKRDTPTVDSDIHTIEFDDGDDLLATNHLRNAVSHMPAKHSRPGMKWTSLFLGEREFRALDEAEQAEGAIRLGHFADVDTGIVTGRNSFFVLTDTLRKELSVERLTLPSLGRTSALKSLVFTSADFADYHDGKPAYLLNLDGQPAKSFSAALRAYIRSGEQHKVDRGYKCRIRRTWYEVPSVYVPNAFLFRQIHSYPLLVINEAKATCTDTVHRVRFREPIDGKLLAASFFNSLTLAWSEVAGRSYGGGVLELEPREAEELPVPFDRKLPLEPDKVDALLRNGCANDALKYVDSIVLKKHLGFTDRMISDLTRAWSVLRDRRKNRR